MKYSLNTEKRDTNERKENPEIEERNKDSATSHLGKS